MKILKMRLENFQGVKELEIDPQGESSAIYGDNGTGKSTVYNAFTWLMYGKPSTTEKNYTPKTTGSHNLHHSVEMTVELADGSEMVLKKDYHEVYKTIKGNPQPVLSGHTTDYSMDGVPVSETQFKKNLLEIYHDEELAKMLTSYNYFLENMKVADRRKILLQVCGDADFNEVIESQGDLLRELPEMLRKPGKAENYYTVDEYRAIAAKEKNLTDKELGDIPQRIDEAEKAKPDVTGLDAQTIDNTMAALMCYATNTPQVDEPSAGYIFTWDMLGNGSYTAMDQYEGENGTHSEFIEGLMSTDMKKTADDLATYFTDCV